MAPTAEQIADLRRMIGEPTTTAYSDVLLERLIADHAIADYNGQEPYLYYGLAGDLRQDNLYWLATYDLNATAADIWREKASVVVQHYTFSADGGSYQRSDLYKNAMAQARHFDSRRAATTTNMDRTSRLQQGHRITGDWYE